jgi:hypothetical protein
MSKSLVLDSLEVQRFRTFRYLQIERLGRVNLVTGKNNVGKSCLLEALWLYASRGSPYNIVQLLDMRDERSYSSVRGVLDEMVQQALAIRYLFYGRKEIQELRRPIRIGPKDHPAESLSVSVEWSTVSKGEGGRREFEILKPDEYDTAESPTLVLVVTFGAEENVYRLDRYFDRRGFRLPEKKDEIPCVFAPANGLNAQQISQMWDAVALTDIEEDVLTSLRIIAPGVERVNLVGDQERRPGRIPIVKLPSLGIPIPLRSMGEGMNRIFGIALALANARDGILLIDEVDSGLHYSVQSEMWRLIVEVAHRLNVQVFATTHSWDCVEAFQKAIQQDPRGDGLLISLRDKEGEPGHVVAVLFDETELAIVTREQIEVR